MRMIGWAPYRYAFSVAACCLSLGFASTSSSVSAQDGAGIGASGLEDASGPAGNITVGDVEVEIRGGADAGRVGELRSAVERAFGISAGEQFNGIIAEQGLARVRQLEGVSGASYRLARRSSPPNRVLIISVDLSRTETKRVETKASFPILHKDSKSVFQVLLNGGMGVFVDTNPWFGQPSTFTKNNPLVQNPAIGADTGRRANWGEANVEYGLAGATQIANSPFYLYGAGTFITVGSAGQDIFRDDARSTTNIEKLYCGFLYVPKDGGPRLNVSAGRQNFTLNDGWLVSQFGSQWNAGPRPGVYLAPRTAHDFAALATVKWGNWVSTSFYLNPNEYEPLESNTHLAGTNLRYNFNKSVLADVTYLQVPRSDSTYAQPGGTRLPREGLSTIAGHFRWADAAVLDGLWIETEAAHQTHSEFSMDAWAAYGTVGYLARQLPWTPSLSYRFAHFSGDKPGTETYERFDTLYSGGLSEWLQGISSAKAMSQSNRQTHRVRLNVAPTPALNLTLDYYRHNAVDLNNLGANPAISTLKSDDLGQELQFVTRWAVSKNLYFLGIAAHAMPGDAIKLASPDGAKPWSTFQAQLFWNF